jgi:hypothetical protein
MTNAVLHLVTNRAGNFHHPSLASAVSFSPRAETEDEQSLRTFLQLRDTTTDYYVLGALNSIYAFPEILAEFGETQRTFNLSRWRKDSDTFYPGKFVNTNAHVFSVQRVPNEFPVDMEWLLSRVDSQTLKIQLASHTYYASARLSNNILYVEWPEELGIQGAIQLDGEWNASTLMHLYHTPVGFPYSKIVEYVVHRDDARRLMTGRGYMSHFFSAQSDIEKCALLYTALAAPTSNA